MTSPSYPRTQPGQADRNGIRVKALAVILDTDRTSHAVFHAVQQNGRHFNRPLGGGVELGESSVEAVVREIREELEADLLDPRLLGVLENIFELDGELGHEVCFIYLGELADPSTIPPEGRSFIDVENPGWVEWRPLRDPDPDVALFPDGLQELVERALTTGA